MFAVTSIHAWWKRMGSKRYPDATELFITADAGGSNSYRARVWKFELQRLADKVAAASTHEVVETSVTDLQKQLEQDLATNGRTSQIIQGYAC